MGSPGTLSLRSLVHALFAPRKLVRAPPVHAAAAAAAGAAAGAAAAARLLREGASAEVERRRSGCWASRAVCAARATAPRRSMVCMRVWSVADARVGGCAATRRDEDGNRAVRRQCASVTSGTGGAIEIREMTQQQQRHRHARTVTQKAWLLVDKLEIVRTWNNEQRREGGARMRASNMLRRGRVRGV